MNIRIAIAGNPNCGKTTLFNLLTGSNQFVGNWPGVTVEKKEGRLKGRDDVTIVDLPGIYSLSPYTLEEVVARNYLVDERPDAILNLVDGTNLERNLYLTTQLTELGIPVVIAINMIDVIRRRGDKIDIEALSAAIGCRIVEISALKGTGIDEAVAAAVEVAKNPLRMPTRTFSGCVEHALAHIEEAAIHNLDDDLQRWYSIKIFERDPQVIKKLGIPDAVIAHIEKDIAAAERELDDDAESIITNERYTCVTSLLNGVYKRKSSGLTATDKIDRIVTNRWLALPIFAVVMFLVYFISVTTVGTWATDFMNDGVFGEGFSFFGAWVPGIPVLLESGLESINCAEWLSGLILDGIVAGVGAVLGFLPQIFVLFLVLAFLEACGYMSRIAFVLDKIFRKFGLSGKSFIPMLIGTGCSVPGIMASRTIESEHDRRMTVITTSFIPCGAKLPVIALIAGALFDNGWWVAPLAYFIGIAAVLMSGIVLKKTRAFSGEETPFVMELPAYHMPTLVNLLRSMWERGWAFVKKAGTIILLSTVFIWLGSSFGFIDGRYVFAPGEVPLEKTVLGGIGIAIGWIFIPLGFAGIETAVATVMGLLAKEEIVAVLGVLDYIGMSKLAGFSFLVFNLLCAPCVAAIGAIKREMNSSKWTWFAIAYQCTVAYATSFCIYQLGMFFSGHTATHAFGAALAFVIIGFVLYLLFRPKPKFELEKK